MVKIEICNLQDCSNKDKDLIGNKALNLGRLISNRFDVPGGFVLTSEFTAPLTESVAIYILNRLPHMGYIDLNKYEQHLRKTMNTSEGHLELTMLYTEIRDHLRPCIDSCTKQTNVEREVNKGLKQIEFNFGYARSSTNVGDIKGTSYAGVFASIPFETKKFKEIFLNIIKKIIDSAYTPEALMAYLKNNYFTKLKGLRLAIIFHKMKKKDPLLSGEVAVCRTLRNEEDKIRMCQGLGTLIMYPRGECIPYTITVCFSDDGDREPDIKIDIAPQEKVAVIGRKGFDIDIIDLNKNNKVQYENFIIDLAKRLSKVSTKIANLFREEHLLIEFVVWDEDNVEIVQARPTISREEK